MRGFAADALEDVVDEGVADRNPLAALRASQVSIPPYTRTSMHTHLQVLNARHAVGAQPTFLQRDGWQNALSTP